MNKKERRLALATALQSAAGDMVVVESLADKIQDKKTKSLVAALEKAGASSEKKTLLIVKEAYDQVGAAGRSCRVAALACGPGARPAGFGGWRSRRSCWRTAAWRGALQPSPARPAAAAELPPPPPPTQRARAPQVLLAGRNVAKLAINTADKINIFDVLNADQIVVEDAALAHVQATYGASSQ
jgi:ribosomal protein L4